MPNYDIIKLVNDSLKHFYNVHETSGYKICQCSSCKKLAFPILIKANRDSQEYEELHRSYMAMNEIKEEDGNREEYQAIQYANIGPRQEE